MWNPFHRKALTAHAQGHHQDALTWIVAALKHQPQDAELYNDKGNIHLALAQMEAAQNAYEQALEINVNDDAAWFNLGMLQQQQEKTQEALLCYQHTLQLEPNHAKAHNNLGQLLLQMGHGLRALRHLNQALALNPRSAHAHNNLGLYYQEHFQWSQAIYHLKWALHHDPVHLDAWFNLANVYQEKGQLDLAARCYQKLLMLAPEHPQGHYNYAMLLFLKGELEQGFHEFEWRWRCPHYEPRQYDAPLWQGEPLNNQTLLIYTEQGYGDTLQFIRYVSLLGESKWILECQPPLAALLAAQPGFQNRIYAQGQPLPLFDWHVPLLSLPHCLQVSTISVAQPYIQIAEPELPQNGPQVGVVWASGYRPEMPETWRLYRLKSCPWHIFRRLFDIPGIQFYSFQCGPHAMDIEPQVGLTDLHSQLQDFLSTAQYLKHMDLIISVDTAVAHLAGAMGLPTWLLLPHQAYWFWGTEETETLWYPTMTLWRQASPQNWLDLILRVQEQLKNWYTTGQKERRFQYV